MLIYVKEKCFYNWFESVYDWLIFRNWYWGIFIFVWFFLFGDEIIVVGLIVEFEKLIGKVVIDLYCYFIDYFEILLSCGLEFLLFCCVEDVFDCWFESGSMLYV